MMRLFGITMVRNEADVIEAFVRHNLSVLDGLVVLDHGSFDATSEILRQLQAEGLPLRVERDNDPAYFQSQYMTRLARDTLARDNADFVFTLDADEFLKFESRNKLEQALGEVPAGMHALMHWLTYVPMSFDNERSIGQDHLRYRVKQERHRLHKVIVGRGLLDRLMDRLMVGNHLVGDPSASQLPTHARLRQDIVALAHCPVRSRGQLESKVIVGYLAFLATRPGKTPFAFHWRELYEELRAGENLSAERLREIACNYGLPRNNWQSAANIELVEDPVALRVELRYATQASVDSLRLLMRFTETLVQRAS